MTTPRSLLHSLKWGIKQGLETHPWGVALGKALIPYCPFMLPHENNYLALPGLITKPRGLILDIGANDGISARYFCRLHRGWQVLSVEANPCHERALRAVKRRHRNFDYRIAAAGAASGQTLTLHTPFYESIPLHTAASCHRDVVEKNLRAWQELTRRPGRVTYRETRTPTVAIDDLHLTPDIVKIDTEGSEFATLQGMEQTIQRARPIFLIELDDDPAAQRHLIDHEYRLYHYDSQRQRFQPAGQGDARGVFFFPNEKISGLPITRAMQ